MAKSLGPLTGERVVERARSLVGKKTVYRLGAGGRDPRAPTAGVKCDCSGMAAWALGVDRYLPNGAIPHLPGGDYLETTNIYRDARSPYGFVAEVPWTQARPGDLVAWPDAGPKRQGHVGVVATVDETGARTVVHCSAGNYRTRGDAVAETTADIFKAHGAVVARVAWVS